jgi:hypothetical protein
MVPLDVRLGHVVHLFDRFTRSPTKGEGGPAWEGREVGELAILGVGKAKIRTGGRPWVVVEG